MGTMTRTGAAVLTPVWAWVRLDLRRRWRSLAALALLVALSFGLVMVATAGARRGASAVDRLRARTHAATVAVAPETPNFDWDRIRALPGVEAVAPVWLSVDPALNLEGIARPDDEDYWFPAGDTGLGRTLERPAVIAGRLADQRRADEAVVTASFAGRHGTKVGDRLDAHLFTPRETDSYLADNVRGRPTGPRQPLRVVGVVRAPAVGDSPHHDVVLTTAAFTARYRANLTGAAGQRIDFGLVRLRGAGAGVADFERRVAALTGRNDIQFLDFVAEARTEKKATGFESGALSAFALAALLAATVLLGQAAGRYGTASAADLQVLRTLGMTGRQATVAAAAGPVLAAAAGALAAAVGAAAVSGQFPIGTAAGYEPDPGAHLDLPVIAGTAAAAVLLIATGAALGGWRALARQRGTAAPRRSVVVAAARTVGLPVPMIFGTRYALEPGAGPTAVPVRSALVGAVAGVLGVLAALTFHAGVADAVSNPERFGHTYQIESFLGINNKDFVPARPALRALAADPDVTAVDDTLAGQVTAAGRPVPIWSYQPVDPRRPLPIVTLSGRLPATAGEVLLAPDTARTLRVKVGGTVTLAGARPATFRVSGTAFAPESATDYAQGSWITAAGYRLLFPENAFAYHQIYVAVRPGADPTAVAARVAAKLGPAGSPQFGFTGLPPQARQLRNVRDLPLALGAFLALLALAATGHALGSTVRRRQHELAVLRALGFTRRQHRVVVLTQTGTLVLVGLLLGVPLGVALGRTVWRVVADSTPVQYVSPVAGLALLLVAPAALLAGVLLAALPGRRAARLRVGDVLRAE